MELDRLIESYMDQESLHSLEGQRGVKNLAKLVNALGYQDINQYGQYAGGFCIGDILAFLEDNSGACEAIVEWIKSRKSPEWADALSKVIENDDLVSEHFDSCPDCGEDIPADTIRGEECENCGHVFNWGPSDD